MITTPNFPRAGLEYPLARYNGHRSDHPDTFVNVIPQFELITVAGCGSMGMPMLRRLHSAGFPVRGFDIRPAGSFGSLSHHVHNYALAVAKSDVLISVVRDQRQTLDLCFDRQGIFCGQQYPKCLVVSSTLSPRFIADLATRLPRDVVLVDAPMSGAPVAAEQGALSFMLGGPSSAIDRLMPLFNAMGKQIFRAGSVGAGMTLKVLNNYVAASSVVAVRRVYELAGHLDVDIAILRGVMRASSGATWYGDRFDDIEWAEQGYDPENTIGILEKDMMSALDAVAEIDTIPDSGFDAAVVNSLRKLKPLGPR